jgi:formylmethanofuran dehydrogenase subunit E
MNKSDWEMACSFHGHACPGLAIGVKVCEAAIEKMQINPALDEELVCVTENDACGVDAVQVLLSCTFGKGNLIYKPTGKVAYSFINRKTNKAMRFYFKFHGEEMEREVFQDYILNAPVDELFRCEEIKIDIPECARIFKAIDCELCNEKVMESKIRFQEGKKVCLDCFKNYSRITGGYYEV